VANFTPQPPHLQGKSPWYPLDRRLGGTQSRSGHGEILILINSANQWWAPTAPFTRTRARSSKLYPDRKQFDNSIDVHALF